MPGSSDLCFQCCCPPHVSTGFPKDKFVSGPHCPSSPIRGHGESEDIHPFIGKTAYTVCIQCKALYRCPDSNLCFGSFPQAPRKTDTPAVHVPFEVWDPYYKDDPVHRPRQNCNIMSLLQMGVMHACWIYPVCTQCPHSATTFPLHICQLHNQRAMPMIVASAQEVCRACIPSSTCKATGASNMVEAPDLCFIQPLLPPSQLNPCNF
jgi:hypothetical protein